VEEFAKVCSAVHVFALPMFKESVPEDPPRNCPAVPEYEREAPKVGVEVATVFTRPVEPMNKAPCDREVNRSAELKVEEAVEKSPPVKPMTVEVEAP